jgi:hypothetical protein
MTTLYTKIDWHEVFAGNPRSFTDTEQFHADRWDL